MMRQTACLVGGLVLLARPALAVEERGRGADPAVVTAIDGFLAEPGLKGGVQGIMIQSLKTGATWYERNANLLLMPASNQKLLTSSAVLNALGPDWTFNTILLRAGNLDDDGTLHGNLILKGSGDPLLEGKDLDHFVESVKAAGIKKVQGRLIADASRFDNRRLGFGWEWDDLPYYYAAEVSGLNLNKNMVSVTVDPGKNPGDPLRISIAPLEKWVTVHARGRTDARGKPASLAVERELGTNDIAVTGVLPVDAKPEVHKPVGVTVVNPAKYAAAYFLDRLKTAGIGVAGGDVDGVAPDSGTVEVARHTSEPLAEILKKMNKPSDNLIAECLLKTLGAEKGKDHVGSWAAGAAAAKEWFKTIGIDPAGVVMEDGCGMSRHDYVTPRSYATVLKTMHSHAYAKVFKESMAIPGVDGTFKFRPIGPTAKLTCRAKDGYVANVSTVSGYVDTKSGEPMLFVIFMNNHQCRNTVAKGVQDKIIEFVASHE